MDFISFYFVIKWMLSSTSWDPDLYQIWSLIWDGLLLPTPPRETSYRSPCNWPQQVFWSRPELTALSTRSSLQAHGQQREWRNWTSKVVCHGQEQWGKKTTGEVPIRRQLVQGTEVSWKGWGTKGRRGQCWMRQEVRPMAGWPRPLWAIGQEFRSQPRVSRSQWWAPARGKVVYILISEGCFWLQGKSRLQQASQEVGRWVGGSVLRCWWREADEPWSITCQPSAKSR